MSSSLWGLCASLTDRGAAPLVAKTNLYLKTQTGAGKVVSAFLLDTSGEAIVHSVDDDALETPLRISTAESVLSTAIKQNDTVAIDLCLLDSQLKELVLKENVTTDGQAHLFPVQNVEGSVSAIVVLIDFTERDGSGDKAIIGELFRYCLSLIVNTIHGEEETRLKQQCQRLLSVARRFFSQLDNLDVLLRGIMSEARRLTSAERCSLFLIDQEHGELVAKVFDNGDDTTQPNCLDNPSEVRIKKGQGIAGHVAETGQLINIDHAYNHPLFYKGLDKKTGFVTKNILCFPIRDEKQIIGVAQLCNKVGGKHFDACDEEVASAFSVYCGISIMHSIVYKKISEAQARTKISNEMLMYHLKINDHEMNKVLKCNSDHSFNQFSQLHFDCRSLPVSETPCYVIHMFESLNFSKRFEIKSETLARFMLYVQRGYRDVPYHNWMHAFSVTHFAFAAIKTFGLLTNEYLSDLECLAYLVSCLCHDLDHRGTNNSYEIREGSLLASLYSSEGSIMEHHHLSQGMCILNTEDCNILQGLPPNQYDLCLRLLRNCILATDLASHFKQMNEYKAMINEGYNKENPTHRLHLLTLLMTCADLCDQIKDWPCAKKVADAVYTEFFHQGDIEKQRGVSPQEMMDRERAVIPDLQINFLENIVLPVFCLLQKLFPTADSCLKIIGQHINLWKEEMNKNGG